MDGNDAMYICICYGKYVFLVISQFVYLNICFSVHALYIHVNRLGLYIFTGCYTYIPKIHIYCNIYIYIHTFPSSFHHDVYLLMISFHFKTEILMKGKGNILEGNPERQKKTSTFTNSFKKKPSDQKLFEHV